MVNQSHSISKPYRKFLSIFIKVMLTFFLGWILYVQVFVNNDINTLTNEITLAFEKPWAWLYIILAISLVPFNWMLESKKWCTLILKFQSFSYRQAIKSVLAGVSLAIMTPGRIGEYGGRLIGILPENRPKAILANFISSIAQNIVNLGIGLIATLIFVKIYLPIQEGVFLSLVFLGACIITVLLLIYFRLDLLKGVLAYFPDWNWVKKIKTSVSAFENVDNSFLFTILGISLVRYLTYTSQYVLLIFFFGVSQNLVISFLGVCTILFVQSNLPLPPALSILARGEMAIFLWSVFTTNVLGIIAATFTLWIINLVIPAVIGTAIISQSKLIEEI